MNSNRLWAKHNYGASMADDDTIMHSMAASMLANKMALYSAGLSYVYRLCQRLTYLEAPFGVGPAGAKSMAE